MKLFIMSCRHPWNKEHDCIFEVLGSDAGPSLHGRHHASSLLTKWREQSLAAS